MADQNDPVGLQEGAADDATPIIVPPVKEEKAEPEEKSEGDTGALQEQEKAPAEELEIVVDGEEPPASKEAAPAWVKDLRKEHRELKARNAELERVVAQGQAPKVADPGPKPTLESCDYDTAVFETKLETWHDGRRKKEAADAQVAQQVEAGQKAWRSRLDAYAASRAELSKQIPDYADAEVTVQGMMDVTQQGIILQGSENAALVIAALGQNPKLAQDLANVKDPIHFAFRVAKLEARLKTQKKTQAPPPEKPVRGTGAVSGSVDSQLERLREQAAKTGDYSKVHEYNRQKRAQR